jgi:dTDP-4-dehydrorhamnose 3,5-epimerase
VSYLCSEEFNPSSEHGINPLDIELDIPFATKWDPSSFVISTKDAQAPSFREAEYLGILPGFNT